MKVAFVKTGEHRCAVQVGRDHDSDLTLEGPGPRRASATRRATAADPQLHAALSSVGECPPVLAVPA